VVEALLAGGAAVDLQTDNGAFRALRGRLSLYFGADLCFVHALLRAFTRHACISACIDAHGRMYSSLLFMKIVPMLEVM
jgi:hypothetical protein